MATFYSGPPHTAYQDAVGRLFTEYRSAGVDCIRKGQLVAEGVVSARLFKGSRLLYRARITLRTGAYEVFPVGTTENVIRTRCSSCGARLVLAVVDPEPVGVIITNHACPSCGSDVEVPA